MPIIRRPPPRQKCEQIPIDLIQNRNLSTGALAVAVYICANAFGCIEIEVIMDRFNLKNYTWRAISKELRDNNIIELERDNRGTRIIFKY